MIIKYLPPFISDQSMFANSVVPDAAIISLSANKITAGTIDASVITVTNLNASNITGGTLSMSVIAANSITADKLSASYIVVGGAASDVNNGVTTISGGKITAGTVTATQLSASYIVVGGAASDVNNGVTTISGGKITAGTVTATQLSASYIVVGGAASDVNNGVTTISGGKITAGSITATQITSSINFGGTMQCNTLNVGASSIYNYIAGNLIVTGNISVAEIYGTNGYLYFDQSGRLQVSNHFDPTGAGTYNSGGSTRYWNSVNAVSFTKQGGFGSFDKGVKLQDGRIVSDLQAILSMKPHPTMISQYGVPRIDPRTIPVPVFKQAADHDGKVFPRDENDRPYTVEDGKKIAADDGEDLGAMMSIILGAIKELNQRMEILEK
jgi:hypothetical protein